MNKNVLCKPFRTIQIAYILYPFGRAYIVNVKERRLVNFWNGKRKTPGRIAERKKATKNRPPSAAGFERFCRKILHVKIHRSASTPKHVRKSIFIRLGNIIYFTTVTYAICITHICCMINLACSYSSTATIFMIYINFLTLSIAFRCIACKYHACK